jgi:hypothetical protein
LRNGLTPAGMEITGIAGWYVINSCDRASVLTKGFRETGVKQVVERVAPGDGGLVLTGPSDVAGLIETGRKLERMWLKLRARHRHRSDDTDAGSGAADGRHRARSASAARRSSSCASVTLKRIPRPSVRACRWTGSRGGHDLLPTTSLGRATEISLTSMKEFS